MVGAPGGVVAGVADSSFEMGPSPAAFTAATVNQYVVLFVRCSIVTPVALPPTVATGVGSSAPGLVPWYTR